MNDKIFKIVVKNMYFYKNDVLSLPGGKLLRIMSKPTKSMLGRFLEIATLGIYKAKWYCKVKDI